MVGIDRNSDVIEIARDRAHASGFPHIALEVASADAVNEDLFDLVVGRYVLIHQSDPVFLLRTAARLVKPEGSVAFHEIRLRQKCDSVPNVPLFELIEKLIRMAFSSALPNYDVGDRLVQCFSDAGLPQPKLFSETPIWNGADASCSWLVDTLRSLLPQLHRMGIALKDIMAIEALEDQLRHALVATQSQVSGPAQICAWARL